MNDSEVKDRSVNANVFLKFDQNADQPLPEFLLLVTEAERDLLGALHECLASELVLILVLGLNVVLHSVLCVRLEDLIVRVRVPVAQKHAPEHIP